MVQKKSSKRSTRAYLIFGMLGILVCSLLCFIPSIAIANGAFVDDFEDGDYNGWLESGTNSQWGSGTWEVVFHNGSNMAHVQQSGSGTHALSHDFGYTANHLLAFDMQVNKRIGTGSAGGGVTVSFLNSFNVVLGSTTLAYPGSIDDNQHHYSAFMSEWASLAGLSNTASISTLNLSFYAWCPNLSGKGEVGFDNVTASSSTAPPPAPIPGSLVLMVTGLLGLNAWRRLRQS